VSVLVARHGNTGATAQAVATSCLVLIAVSWVVGRRTVRDDTEDGPDNPHAIWYVVGVTGLFLTAVAVDGMSTYVLVALCPMAFLCLKLRPALVAVAVLNLAPLPIDVMREGGVGQLSDHAAVAGVGLALSVLIGMSVDRIARQSAERARLITALEASRADVAALSHQAGVAAERARLAVEIHDTLAQGFTSIVTLLQASESEVDTNRVAANRRLALAVRTARENLAEARAMVTVLAPADLRAGEFADVVTRQVARLAEDTGVSTSCVVEGIPVNLPTTVEVVLIRALQEALANVGKHARATAVTVDLLGAEGTVTLTVSDDGIGFRQKDAHGYGLRGMRARAEQVGGALSIQTAPRLGTTLTLELPA
jgi:signal transduction histidine kinase